MFFLKNKSKKRKTIQKNVQGKNKKKIREKSG